MYCTRNAPKAVKRNFVFMNSVIVNYANKYCPSSRFAV